MDALKSTFIIVFFAVIAIEIIWSVTKKKHVYNLKDSLSNLFIIIGGKIIKPITLAWGYYLFTSIEPYKLFEIPVNIFTAILTFFLVELIYYWYHRLSHEIPILWTIHHTHHSSPWFNISTAGRLNWLGKFTSPLFYIPMVLLGFSPFIITTSLGLSLIYQIFIHTEMIGKLGFLEGAFFNTPSAHRVHHASNKGYIDKNYGGMLIIFDRIFGTYVPEQEKVKYGVTTGFLGHNPFKIVFYPLYQYLKGLGNKKERRKITGDYFKRTPEPHIKQD
ncbi:sterol desaturase family protein [Fulvivirgaceae bacterium BMA10]|uniref:Sterol desaturase family protein n=1 Tax=Splendidivirga corallicola TaxID=3051826 RepID=A0ABT8KZN0_9BACT|nr:sterol desaturase family protein [Fulvivirgaceae bacterium BMA10]